MAIASRHHVYADRSTVRRQAGAGVATASVNRAGTPTSNPHQGHPLFAEDWEHPE